MARGSRRGPGQEDPPLHSALLCMEIANTVTQALFLPQDHSPATSLKAHQFAGSPSWRSESPGTSRSGLRVEGVALLVDLQLLYSLIHSLLSLLASAKQDSKK